MTLINLPSTELLTADDTEVFVPCKAQAMLVGVESEILKGSTGERSRKLGHGNRISSF